MGSVGRSIIIPEDNSPNKKQNGTTAILRKRPKLRASRPNRVALRLRQPGGEDPNRRDPQGPM